MEIIFGLLYEIIVEGAMGAVKDSDLLIGIRIGAGLFLFILALALVVLIISVLVKPPKDTD